MIDEPKEIQALYKSRDSLQSAYKYIIEHPTTEEHFNIRLS